MTSGSTFDAGKLRQQLAEIEKQAADPNLWSNPQKSQQVMREKKRLEEVLSTEAELIRRSDDISAYFELAREGETVDRRCISFTNGDTLIAVLGNFGRTWRILAVKEELKTFYRKVRQEKLAKIAKKKPF